jgi:hypothetical protein
MACPRVTGQDMQWNETDLILQVWTDALFVQYADAVTGISYLMRKSACLQTKEYVFSAVRCVFSAGANMGECGGSFVVFWCSNSKMTNKEPLRPVTMLWTAQSALRCTVCSIISLPHHHHTIFFNFHI